MEIDDDKVDKKRKVERNLVLEDVLKQYALATNDVLEVVGLLGMKVLELEKVSKKE